MIHFRNLLGKKRDIYDKTTYIISEQVIKYTEQVLLEYASMKPSNEGLVYWGGCVDKNTITISTVIAPKTESSSGRVSTSYKSNFDFVIALNEREIIEIAQVHSHPGSWVDHSDGDSEWAPFKSEGLISIVVPNYGSKGMLPLTRCGVHRYSNEKFIRLSNHYIENHFKIKKLDSEFIELRR